MFTMLMSRKQGERLVESLTRYAAFLDRQAMVMRNSPERLTLHKASAQALMDAQSVTLLMDGEPADARCIECHKVMTVIAGEEGDLEVTPHICVG